MSGGAQTYSRLALDLPTPKPSRASDREASSGHEALRTDTAGASRLGDRHRIDRWAATVVACERASAVPVHRPKPWAASGSKFAAAIRRFGRSDRRAHGAEQLMSVRVPLVDFERQK